MHSALSEQRGCPLGHCSLCLGLLLSCTKDTDWVMVPAQCPWAPQDHSVLQAQGSGPVTAPRLKKAWVLHLPGPEARLPGKVGEWLFPFFREECRSGWVLPPALGLRSPSHSEASAERRSSHPCTVSQRGQGLGSHSEFFPLLKNRGRNRLTEGRMVAARSPLWGSGLSWLSEGEQKQGP